MDEILLKRIVNHQMLYGSFCGDLGVLNGKMGIVLFFFHYARYTKNVLYEDFAAELLEEIYEDVHLDMNIQFLDGLCGIGWGITYLVEQQFVTGDIEELLQDIDRKIMEFAPKRLTDYSLETGLEGIAYYVMGRLKVSPVETKLFSVDYVEELEEIYLASWRSSNVYSSQRILDRIMESDNNS